jgi:hypothetical protein
LGLNRSKPTPPDHRRHTQPHPTTNRAQPFERFSTTPSYHIGHITNTTHTNARSPSLRALLESSNVRYRPNVIEGVRSRDTTYVCPSQVARFRRRQPIPRRASDFVLAFRITTVGMIVTIIPLSGCSRTSKAAPVVRGQHSLTLPSPIASKPGSATKPSAKAPVSRTQEAVTAVVKSIQADASRIVDLPAYDIGVYDAGTVRGVKNLQRAMGLSEDGRYGQPIYGVFVRAVEVNRERAAQGCGPGLNMRPPCLPPGTFPRRHPAPGSRPLPFEYNRIQPANPAYSSRGLLGANRRDV